MTLEFEPNKIYTFKIDLLGGFYTYGKVSHKEDNKYTFKKFVPKSVGKNSFKFKDIEKEKELEYVGLEENKPKFKPPPYDEGVRKGDFDYWILDGQPFDVSEQVYFGGRKKKRSKRRKSRKKKSRKSRKKKSRKSRKSRKKI